MGVVKQTIRSAHAVEDRGLPGRVGEDIADIGAVQGSMWPPSLWRG